MTNEKRGLTFSNSVSNWVSTLFFSDELNLQLRSKSNGVSGNNIGLIEIDTRTNSTLTEMVLLNTSRCRLYHSKFDSFVDLWLITQILLRKWEKHCQHTDSISFNSKTVMRLQLHNKSTNNYFHYVYFLFLFYFSKDIQTLLSISPVDDTVLLSKYF